MTVDRRRQYNSPYLGMGNNPIMKVDKDSEFVFTTAVLVGIGVGTVISASLEAYNLHQQGRLNSENGLSSGLKIGTAAITGGLIGAIPGGTVAIGSLSAGTIAGATAAGTTAFFGDITSQYIDFHFGFSKEIQVMNSVYKGGLTAVTFGVGDKLNPDYSIEHKKHK